MCGAHLSLVCTGESPHHTARPQDDPVLTDMAGSLFASLSRTDQRRKGVEYVSGLLATPGRKSIRNIASLIGGRATDQSLHHFISESTWDWIPVRRALAHYLVGRLPVTAWVLQNMVIRKAGQHSVGVDRTFVPAAGRVLNAQQAVGVWAASEGRSSPVEWGLHLPQGWIDDGSRRSRASIPESAALESLADRAARLCLAVVAEWAMPVRPVVLDARKLDVHTIMDCLGRQGVPVVARVDESVPLAIADPALTGHSGSATMPAGRVMRAARGTRHPVWWRRPGTFGGGRTVQVARVAVTAPLGRGPRRRPGTGRLALLGLAEGMWEDSPQLWLTHMRRARPAALLNLCGLLDRVERDYSMVARNVGMEDYAGRSFDGWHRHMTLASAAHAVAVLTRAANHSA